VIEPLPFAVPDFIAETRRRRACAQHRAGGGGRPDRHGAVPRDPAEAHIDRLQLRRAGAAYADWKAINAQALITGSVNASGDRADGEVPRVRRVLGPAAGRGAAVRGLADGWRRMAHKVADQVYSRITGEGGYFDSRVVFVAESGPKDARLKRLAVMDYDGANVQYLTDSSPSCWPRASRPMATGSCSPATKPAFRDLRDGCGQHAAPRAGRAAGHDDLCAALAPDGRTVVFSLEQGGNTDIYTRWTAAAGPRRG
jgi:TolB protein